MGIALEGDLGMILKNMAFSLSFSPLWVGVFLSFYCFFLEVFFFANSDTFLDVVQATYTSNFWNECPTPFHLGLDRMRESDEGWGQKGETDHSSYWGQTWKDWEGEKHLASHKSACYVLLARKWDQYSFKGHFIITVKSSDILSRETVVK